MIVCKRSWGFDMTTKVAKKSLSGPQGNAFLRDMRLQIRCRPHTTHTLARKLGVSTATVARGILELRRVLARGGERLVSVKEGNHWHYEIREREDVWENDPFLKIVGLVNDARPASGEGVDDALYGKRGTDNETTGTR
jgi:biotin operon repressor